MTTRVDTSLRSRRRTFGRSADTLLDTLFRKAKTPARRSEFPDALTILNNGTGSVFPGMIYGRNSSGRVAAAIATAANTIEPLWVAISQAGRNQPFIAAVAGSLELAVRRGTGATNPTRKEVCYLSEFAAGKITFVRPGLTNIRYAVGRAARTTILGSGKVLVDFNLPLTGAQNI